MFAVLVVGLLLTLAVAIIGWFRPVAPKPPAAPTYSAQQVADAKKKVCAAYSKVHNAIQATSDRDKGPDYATQLASAVNARQALVIGSQYLFSTINNEPAAPADITAKIRSLANTYQLLTVQLLAEAPDSEINSSVHSGDEATSALDSLCK